MFIEIGGIADAPGAKIVRKGKCDFSAWQALVKMEPLVKEPVMVEATAENDGARIVLKLRQQFTLHLECDRCAKEITAFHDEEFDHPVVTGTEAASQREAEIGFAAEADQDGKIELDPLVWDNIMSSVPTRLLCTEECRGVCLNCGKNLNDGPCGCEEPRMITIEDTAKEQ